jgi:hypothetical protein
MDIAKVIDRAISDPEFAAELYVKASRASKAGPEEGVTTPAMMELIALFAESPTELARLTSGSESQEEGTTTTTTTTTITTTTTVTSLPCGITSTTTTTGTTFTTTGAVTKKADDA